MYVFLFLSYHSETARQVTPEDPRLQGLDVPSDVGLRLQKMSVPRQLVEHLLLFVWEDDVGMVGLDHQQGLAQSSRPLPQDLDQSIPWKT